MHKTQQDLLRLAQEKNLGQFTLREIGALIGVPSAQKIKHHLSQLEKKGLLRIDKARGLIRRTAEEWGRSMAGKAKLLTIPIVGAANAGPATILAETNIEGFLKISATLLSPAPKREHRFFALKVVGPSMNRATIQGKRIEDGDYVIVDADGTDVKSGDIVLSIIDGMANIKRFHVDRENRQIVLMAESTKDFPPIYIHEDDNFMVNGKVVQVIKKPRFGL